MKMTPLKSSMLAAASYDPETRELTVEFRNGNHYRYEEVSQAIFDDFLGADSQGGFFARRIKGVYPSRKL
jgi:hypothetical protein